MHDGLQLGTLVVVLFGILLTRLCHRAAFTYTKVTGQPYRI